VELLNQADAAAFYQ